MIDLLDKMMDFLDPLIEGKFIRRYKRFFAEVQLLNGEIVLAHCANPGSMMNLLKERAAVWLSPARNKKRKLQYTWEMICIDGCFVGVNTHLTNKIIEEAIKYNFIPELSGYGVLRREVKYDNGSRIDILLQNENSPDCFVEIKSVTLNRHGAQQSMVEFPDSVTARGTKHLKSLAREVKKGNRSVLIFLVQRDDGQIFSVAGDIDPKYEEAYRDAKEAGVEMLCYGCRVSPEGISVNRKLKFYN